MLPALFRTIYFLGPLLALALVLMPGQRQLARVLWAVAAVIVAFHWISFFSAIEDNATEIGTLWAAIWTPLLVTTALAAFLEKRWHNWHSNPLVLQGTISVICLVPSVIAFFLTG